MPRDAEDTRRRILQAADDLFYAEGIRAVSVDAIAERAGLTKRTLYYHFRSKDDLIAAYLAARDEPTLARYQAWLDNGAPTFADQIAGLYRGLGRAASDTRWRGCGFVRTAAELAGVPGHPALKVGARHKKRFEAWLETRIREEGLPSPALRARQLMVLLDGTVAEMMIHRDTAYAEAAAEAAKALLTMRG